MAVFPAQYVASFHGALCEQVVLLMWLVDSTNQPRNEILYVLLIPEQDRQNQLLQLSFFSFPIHFFGFIFLPFGVLQYPNVFTSKSCFVMSCACALPKILWNLDCLKSK